MVLMIALAGSCISASNAALSRELGQDGRYRLAQTRNCPQVIHCGIKNGQPKEYPTRCAAEDDGATNIVPKTGQTCPATK